MFEPDASGMNEETGVLRASIGYPFRGEGWRTRLLLGGGLNFLAGVVVAAAVAAAVALVDAGFPPALGLAVVLGGLLAYVPLFGYVAASARALLDDEDEPPEFGALDDLTADGLRVAGVTLGYAAPVVALVWVASAAADLSGGVVAGLVGLVGLLYALGAAYVLPAAVVTVVYEGTTAAARDAGTLRAAVVDRSYLRAWTVGAAVWLAGTTAGAALSPLAVGFVVLFVAQLAAVYAATRGVVAALEIAVSAPPAPPASGYVPGWDDGARRKELTGGLGGALLPDTPDEADDDLDRPDDPASGSIATAAAGDAGTDLDRVAEAGAGGDGEPVEERTDIEPAADGDDDHDRYDGS